MKTLICTLISLAVCLFLSSCGDDHHHHGESHHHEAPHGGTLVELGEHGTGFNLEVVHNAETGDLAIHVYDGHASNPVRIKQESIVIAITAPGEYEAALAAVANPAYEESIGDTSFFEAKGALPGVKEFEGSVKSVTIKGKSFENIAFSYPAENDHHED